MIQSESLTTNNAANRVNIAVENALDAKQDKATENLSSDIKLMERDVRKLQSNFNLLKLRFQELPDLSMLTDYLVSIAIKNAELE